MSGRFFIFFFFSVGPGRGAGSLRSRLKATCISAHWLSKWTFHLCINRPGLSPVCCFPLLIRDAPAFLPSSALCTVQPAYPDFLAICALFRPKPALIWKCCAEVNTISSLRAQHFLNWSCFCHLSKIAREADRQLSCLLDTMQGMSVNFI